MPEHEPVVQATCDVTGKNVVAVKLPPKTLHSPPKTRVKTLLAYFADYPSFSLGEAGPDLPSAPFLSSFIGLMNYLHQSSVQEDKNGLSEIPMGQCGCSVGV